MLTYVHYWLDILMLSGRLLLEWWPIPTILFAIIVFIIEIYLKKSWKSFREWLISGGIALVIITGGTVLFYAPYIYYQSLKSEKDKIEEKVKEAKETIGKQNATIEKLQTALNEKPKIIYRAVEGEKDKRTVDNRKKREEIAKFMDEGQIIRKRFLTSEPENELLKAKTAWEKRVEQYLLVHLENSYATRFRNPGEVSPSVPIGIRMSIAGSWSDMGKKIEMLNVFIAELHD